MHPANTTSAVDETNALPLARIDGQDEMFIFPLREYLETNGCRVISNQGISGSVDYHIVAGSPEFVKHILESSGQHSIRQLGIVIHSSFSDAKSLASDKNKIVVVDPIQLSQQDVVEIFSFFFAGNSDVFDKRRNRHVPSHQAVGDTIMTVSEPAPVLTRFQQTAKDHLRMQEESESDAIRIKTLIKDVFGADDIEKRKKEKERRSVARRKQQRKGIGFFFIFLLLLFLPPLWYAVSIAVSAAGFGFAGRELRSGNIERAKKFDSVALYWLRQSEVAFGITGSALQAVGAEKTIRGQERLLSFFRDIATIYKESYELVGTGRQAASLLLSPGVAQEGSPAVLMEKLRLSVVSVHGSLGLAQAQLQVMLEEQSFPFAIPAVGKKGREIAAILADVRRQFGLIDHFLVLYPRISGFETPTTYLVLLQNSNELRPTGGFIGSLAKLSFEQGKLVDFVIQDVYAVDGQLKGHVPPPAPIAEIIGQEHWYLRDSNWDPDFKVSGEQAAWFYEKETGEQVDGVIAINVPVIVDLLNVTGPLILSDYNDRITAENFFGKSIYYTQSEFFPGSTQKSDFLGALARTLITRLTTDKTIPPEDLFRAFSYALERKDIMFYFRKPELEELAEHFQWAGRLFPIQGCHGVKAEICLFDPFIFSEANVSVSKVNYFVKRSILREIVIGLDGQITETVTADIRNEAAGEERGVSGSYFTYIRFFVPGDASIQDVTLDGATVPSRKTTDTTRPEFPYIERVDAPEKMTGLGAAIEIAPGASRQVKITYKRGIVFPMTLNRGSEAVLDVMYSKQPGVSGMPLVTRVYYPAGWHMSDESRILGTDRSGALIAKEGEFEYNNTVSADQFVRVRFLQ